jgi:hypothetical protein
VKARAVAAGCIAFLAWFTMKFRMDNANDSETHAYVGGLVWNAQHATLTADATGHYTGLAAYVMWPVTGVLGLVTGAYEIRGLAIVLVGLSFLLYGLSYLWWAELGLGWPTRLLGLALLSIAVAFAVLIRGWEIDKLIEPCLFLLAALCAWRRQFVAFVVVAALAAANRETGLFMPLVAAAALIDQRSAAVARSTRWSAPAPAAGADAGRGSARDTAVERWSARAAAVGAVAGHWSVWLSAVVCLAIVVWLRTLLPPPALRPWADLSLQQLVYVGGGLCVLPVLAVAWRSAASPGLRWLLYVLSPMWLVYVLATDRLEQGMLLLAPLALVWLPISLAGLEQPLLRRLPLAHRTGRQVDAGVPATPAERESTPVAPGT